MSSLRSRYRPLDLAQAQHIVAVQGHALERLPLGVREPIEHKRVGHGSRLPDRRHGRLRQPLARPPGLHPDGDKKLARRTVTKYRQALLIPSSRQRRQF
jgi:hypothetical protein